MITLKETVGLTCNNSINSFSDILGKKIRENYRAEDGAVSRPELFYLMTVMPDIIVERKNFYRQIFHLENQIVFSSLTGHQTCRKTELGGILSLQQPQNIRAAAAVRLVARGNKPENRQETHLKIETRNLPVKDGKEPFGRGPWDKSGEYGPFGEMQRNWRGIKLAKIVLLSKGVTEPKGNIALQSNFLADSAGDIDIIQRCEKPAGQNEGIVEHSRIFSEFVREFIQQRKKLEESKMKLILQRGRLAESKIKLILQRERLEGSIKEVIRQSEKLAGSKQDIIRQRGKQSEPKGDLIQQSRIFSEFERNLILQREKLSESKKEFILQREKSSQSIKERILRREKLSQPIKESILRNEKPTEMKGKIVKSSRYFSDIKRDFIQQREKQSEWKKELILQRGKLSEPIKESILRSETLAGSRREIIKQSKIFSEFKRGLIQQSEKQSELKENIIQQSRILPELKRELIQRVEKQSEQRGDFIQRSRILPESTRESILQTEAYLNLWDNTTLKTQSTTNLQDNAVWQRKEMANLHGSSIRHTESLTEPMEDTTRKEEPLIHLPDQPKPQADAIQPKPSQTDDQKLFQYLCEINEHNLKMQRRLEQIKPEAQNEIPLAIDKKEARKKSLLALKDPEKVLMEIDRSGGNPMSKTDSKIQSILNLADQDTRLLLEDVMAYPKTGQGRAFQITETDMGGLNHFLREMAEEPPGFQEISRETEKSQRDAEEIRKETVKITREEMEKNSRVLMQNVEELLQSKMESVSDRVYRELERRLKNDQRRRGY